MAIEFGGNSDARGFRQIITGRNEEQGLDNEFLLKVKEMIRYTESNEGNNNISKCPREYCLSWRYNMEPWYDMIQKGDKGRSVFTNKIIEIYEEANRCIEETAGNNEC